MAASVNKVILIGNLGSDPEVRYLESGSAVAKFSIATTESYTNKSGERVDNTEWHRIELWEGLAKVAEKYLKKGGQVYVEGKIRTDRYTDKEGVDRTSITIRGNSLTLLGSAPAGGSDQQQQGGATTNQNKSQQDNYANNPPTSNFTPPSDDDDLPF